MGNDYFNAFPIGDPYTEIRKRYFSEVSRWIDKQLEPMAVAERIEFLRDLLDKERYALPLSNQEQERDRIRTIEKLKNKLKKSKQILRVPRFK